MVEAGDEAVGTVPEPAHGEAEFPAQFVHVHAAAVLQFLAFEQVPQPFRWVQVRRIGGQPLQMESLRCTGGKEVFDRLAAMDGRAVPDHEQLASHLAQQLAQEADDRWPAEGRLLDVGEEPAIGGEGADHREMVVGERRTQHRRLAHRRIGTSHEWQQIQPGLIYEEDGPVLGPGFAKRAGQVAACHAAIAASFRWVARTTGFWRLNPSRRTSRLT